MKNLVIFLFSQLEKKKLHVHKGVLSARSPVFEAMFEHDMAEKKTNFVILKI